MTEDRKSTRWAPGQSGNPKGRPRGKTTAAALRAKLGSDVDQILSVLVRKARAGDVQAARTVLERCMPALKAAEQPVAIEVPDGAGLVARGEAILDAAAAGDLAPGQASQLLSSLATLAKLVETEELEARITALEQRGSTQ